MLKKMILFGAILMTINFVYASEDDTKNTYALTTGQKASQTLDKQNELLGANTYEHLKKAGLSSGQTVCDIGCGNGAMTVYLAQQVGETGHVYAIDLSQEQLEVAKAKVKAAGLDNVTFIRTDVRTQEGLPLGIADLIYMRFVLMHVPEPALIIATTKALLKAGGVTVSQESVMHTAYSSPEHEVFKEFFNILIALGKKLGVDYDIGEKLELLYKQAGYANTTVYYEQMKLNLQTVKEFLPLRLAEWKDKAIAAGVMSEDKAKELDQAIRNFPEDDKDFFFAPGKQAHVLAWKPS